jgi:hypothetical protein
MTSPARPWTAEDLAALRRLYPTTPAPAIAAALGRSPSSIYQAAAARGLTKASPARRGRAWLAELRRLNALGISDTGASRVLGSERHTVSLWRKRLGLPENAHSVRQRARAREATARQCASLGVPSLAAVRSLAFKLRAINAGWPAGLDLRPRELQILDALEACGPMTRRELAAAIGMPWKGPRKSLTGNVPGGSYLAHLLSMNLVTCLGRIEKRNGRGRSVNVYSLALDAERRAGRMVTHG